MRRIITQHNKILIQIDKRTTYFSKGKTTQSLQNTLKNRGNLNKDET